MKFEDSLPLLAHFQNGCPEENAERPQLMCQFQYCLKQKVLCVFIANYGVNNEKSEILGLPGVLKMLTMEKSKKPKLTKLTWNMNFYVSDFNCHLFMIFAFKYICCWG